MEEALVDAPGLSFVFEINNIRVFCGGQCLDFSRPLFRSQLLHRLELDSRRLFLDEVFNALSPLVLPNLSRD